MKRNLIALAVAAALVAPMAANAAPKVYGQLNISAESYKKDISGNAAANEEYTRLQSNASRFGVKGEDELTATLSAIYGIEWQVNGDGEGADLAQRNRYVGIKSQNLGTVKLGKLDTNLKNAQGKIDLFNDFAGDIEYTVAGENRINNVIAYESPKFFNTEIGVLTQTQDASTATAGTPNYKNGSSVSVVHNNEELGLYLALAVDQGVESKTGLWGNTSERDNVRLVASYKIADLTLNALYGTSEGIDGKKAETAFVIGSAYKINDFVLKAQYSAAEVDSEIEVTTPTGSLEKTSISLGADYNLTSKTRAFAWLTQREDTKKLAANTVEETILALGVEHKF